MEKEVLEEQTCLDPESSSGGGRSRSNTGDLEIDEGISIGYSLVSKTFRVYNRRLKIVEDTVKVKFDEVSATQKMSLHNSEVLELTCEGCSDANEDSIIRHHVESSTNT